MLADVVYALRLMRKNRLFTGAVVGTIALAIAANATVFSVVNAVIIRPLPFKDSGRLVQVAEKNDKLNLPTFSSSVLNFLSWREQTRTFEELAAVGFANYTLTGPGDPEQLSGNRISPALMRVLGLCVVDGRAFRDDEERPSAAPVAMVGEGLWKRRFGQDRSLIGKTITLNGVPTTVVGVAPSALNLISGGDVYTPLTVDPAKEIRLNHVLLTIGRLKQGVSIQQAQQEMDTISAGLGRQYPEIHDWGINLVSFFDTFVNPQLKTGLLVLLCAVGFVLLIACANIANLLLARGSARQSEMAMRAAMGASAGRLVGQLLIESATLSLTGGIAGFIGAFWALHAINRLLPPNTLPIPRVEMDGTVLAFAFGLILASGLLFGIVPAFRLGRASCLSAMLGAGARGQVGNSRPALRNTLAAAELAMATMLVVVAGLLIRSLVSLERVRLGFDSRGLITFQLAPPPAKYPLKSGAPELYREVLNSLRSIPGTDGACVSSGIPFGAGNYARHPMTTTDQSILPPGTLVPIDLRMVSPGYFKVMRISFLRGRDFTDADGPAAPGVIIVSEATAKKFWGDADAIGHTLRLSADLKTPYTIVGIVGDVRGTALNQQEFPTLYFPMAAKVRPLMDVAVRTANGPAEALLPAIREKVHELDPQLALATVRTMDEWVSSSAAQPRFSTILLTGFAAVSLLIASVGIYGVLAYSVSTRTAEIGVRMALGATRGTVLRLIVGEGMKVALIGIGTGLGVSLAVASTLSSLMFGIQPRDPSTFGSVAVTLAAVALAACAVPSFRAARVDPMAALRRE